MGGRARRNAAAGVTASLLVLLAAAPAAQATSRGPTPSGVIRGRTVITWTGTKGITLRTPANNVLSMPADRMELYVQGGSYAFVSLDPPRHSGSCYFGESRCNQWMLGFIRGARLAGAVGHDHITDQPDPPDFRQSVGRPIEVYLFTDGRATLVLRPKGLTGSASYVAGGTIRGRAERLPIFCPTAGCNATTGYGNLAFGGAAYDVGDAGFSSIWAYAATVQRHDEINSQRVCDYPSLTDASPADPASHPYGCDLVAGDGRAKSQLNVVQAEEYAAQDYANTLRSEVTWGSHTAVHGLQYEGYRISMASSDPIDFGGFAFWYGYGIGHG